MPTELSLTAAQVLAWRMRRNALTKPKAGIGVVAEQLVGVQAQVMSSAEIALSIRAAKTTPGAVRSALWSRRTLVKTWTQRGTLHLVTPADLDLIVAVMTMRGEYWAKPSWAKFHGVTPTEMRSILDAMDVALSDQPLTRVELAAELARITKRKQVAEQMMGSWGGTIKPAAFGGKLCFGPNRGRNVTFVSPTAWLGPRTHIDGDEALATLTRRYLDTYGPATKEDVVRWLGIEAKFGRRAWELLQDELVAVEVDGQTEWLTRWGARDILKTPDTSAVRMLPTFDPYVVGVLKGLERLLPNPALRDRISRTAGWISATVVADGAVVGTWTYTRKGADVEIEVTPLTKWGKELKASVKAEQRAMTSLMATLPAGEDALES